MQKDFYDVLTHICIEHNESVSGAAKAVGLSSAAASGWKKGKKPTYLTLVKLAQHFNESLDVFRDFIDDYSEKEKSPIENDERITPEIRELMEICGNDPAMLKELLDYAKFKKANR